MAEDIGADEAQRLADALEWNADLIERRARRLGARVPDSVALDRAAARLLRVQGEQLDTLRNAIEAHRDSDPDAEFHDYEANHTLWAALDALARAGGGVPETGERLIGNEAHWPIAGGDVLIGLAVYPNEHEPLDRGEWVVQTIVDASAPEEGATDE